MRQRLREREEKKREEERRREERSGAGIMEGQQQQQEKKKQKVLSKEEDDMYDRQIRVWGVDTQCAIRNAKVGVVVVCDSEEEEGLDVQHVAAAELVKNLALAGIGDLKICYYLASDKAKRETGEVLAGKEETKETKESNDVSGPGSSDAARVERKKQVNLSFLGQSVGAIGANLSDMNSRMRQVVEQRESIADLFSGETSTLDVTAVFGRNLVTLNEISETLVEGKRTKLVFAAGVRGGCGFAFLRSPNGGEGCATSLAGSFLVKVEDLPRKMNKLYSVLRCVHRFQSQKGSSPTSKDVDAIMKLAEEDEKLPSKQMPSRELVLNYLETEEEMPAVSSVVGGSLAQEVIKAISGKGELMNNFYLYSAYGSPDSGEAKVECMVPKN